MKKILPEGYKKTSLGLIPNNWEEKKLKEILKEARLGGNYENSESNFGIPVIKMGNVGRGKINIDMVQCLPKEEPYNSIDILKEGDLLFNTRNTLELVGKVAIWQNELSLAVYNSNLLKMVFEPSIISNNWFMNYAFNSNYGLRQLRRIATGTTSVAAIYSKDLLNIHFLIPPIEDQLLIVEILKSVEIAIDKNNQLLNKKWMQKKWLIQQLLTGKKRLKGFDRPWVFEKIGNIAKELSLKNRSNKDVLVLSCTKYDGLVPSLEYFGRKIYSNDLSTYKIVPKNHFAYATNHIEEGSIGYQKSYDEALISPMYTVFETSNTINDGFLYKLLKSHHYIHQYQKRMEGSIDRRGGLRWDEFSKIKIPVPHIDEQTAIAEVLQIADNEIQLLKAKVDKLNDQKKGMMQLLLTGKKQPKIK